MAITYSALTKKESAIIFMKPRGVVAHRRHTRYALLKSLWRGSLPSLQLSLMLPAFFGKPTSSPSSAPSHPPQSLQWPACDHAGSESYCVVDNLLPAAVHLMYRCVTCWGCQLRPQNSSCSLCPEEGEVSAGQPWKRKLFVWGHTLL